MQGNTENDIWSKSDNGQRKDLFNYIAWICWQCIALIGSTKGDNQNHAVQLSLVKALANHLRCNLIYGLRRNPWVQDAMRLKSIHSLLLKFQQ